MYKNLILMADSYKMSHFLQYPKGTEGYYGYIESRGCAKHWDKTLFFGLQTFIKEYLLKPITQADIGKASVFCSLHGVPFNKAGWETILTKYDGFLPIKIKALPEGSVVPTRVPLVTVEVTDPEMTWVGSYIETALLRAVWYPTTVATNSYYCRQIIKKAIEKTGTPESINFKLHDFGARGVSSGESAAIGGMAHLATGFQGSDTIEAVLAASEYYNEPMAAFSIPAAEHSTITSWGKENEVEAYRNMVKQFSKDGSIYAVVSDSYDIFNACEKLWGEALKQEVIDSKGLLVIRPDSGQPDIIVRQCVEILDSKFGHTINEKGYKVLNNVRVIQGDGINEASIANILGALEVYGYSADNVAFGMGGALLQALDRDTLKFAMKMSAIKINGKWQDVFKDPITDQGKRSKKGRVTTFKVGDEYVAGTINDPWEDNKVEVLQLVYENGKLYNETTFAEVRERANVN